MDGLEYGDSERCLEEDEGCCRRLGLEKTGRATSLVYSGAEVLIEDGLGAHCGVRRVGRVLKYPYLMIYSIQYLLIYAFRTPLGQVRSSLLAIGPEIRIRAASLQRLAIVLVLTPSSWPLAAQLVLVGPV